MQLTQTIDAKKAKPGDEVVTRVTMDLKTNSGEVIVPKDTKVVGHVTEAQARSKEQKESQVGIAFDRAVLKDGEVSLPMSIQAVIAPPSNDANSSGSYNQGTPTLAPAGSTGSSPMGSGRTGSVGASQTQPSNPLPTAGTTASEGSRLCDDRYSRAGVRHRHEQYLLHDRQCVLLAWPLARPAGSGNGHLNPRRGKS